MPLNKNINKRISEFFDSSCLTQLGPRSDAVSGMWVWNWFWSLLKEVGLFQKKAKLVFLGLDNAGKTTLMNLLVNGQVQTFMPTQKPTTEEFQQDGIHFVTHDLGGHQIARRIWTEYGADADGIIFLVDSHDHERLDEAQEELANICREEAMEEIPILVLGNKIDLPNSLSEVDLHKALSLNQLQGISSARPMQLFMCSLVKKQGYKEGIQWLSQNLL